MTGLRELGTPGSDELLRLVVESATDFAIIAMDKAGVVTGWNTGAERLLGFVENEIIGHTADVIFVPEDRAIGGAEHERAGARTKGRAEDERWHQRKDGSRFWGSGVMMALADGSGYVKIFRDLTERREAEERVRKSEELFRLLATNIPQLVFRTKHDGYRTWGSPQWILFTGLSFDDSLRFGWLDVVHPEDRAETAAAWAQATRSGEYYIEHRILRSADNEFRWHQTRAKPAAEADGEWVGTSTDIHEMRGLQERQKILLAELQHRTRNLLAVVQSIARQTERNSGSLPEFATEFEGRLRALTRVQGLLARVADDAIDLHDLVQAELEAHADGDLADKASFGGPAAILSAISAQAMALAIHELATNAVKYGAFKQPAGKLAVTWRIENGSDAEPRVVLDWRESGVDMPGPGGRPTRKGYGTELIERALPYQLKAQTRFEFGPDGVHCRIATAIEPPEMSDG